LMLWMILLGQLPAGQADNASAKDSDKVLEKSPYYAFVDRDYIFTLEMVKPGVPILNFVSLSENESILLANQIRLTEGIRKIPARLFKVDTGDPKQPVVLATLTIHAKSSFGVTLTGDFDGIKEPSGVTVGIGSEDFRLKPLTSFDFENLALKINRINLNSPDFSDDWRVLKLEYLGSRVNVRKATRARD
jgi:hypothetical protein